MARKKPNKWSYRHGKIIRDENGRTAVDVINCTLEETFAPVEDAAVSNLHSQDKALVQSRMNRIGENIDRKRLNKFNEYLNETLSEFADIVIEAGRNIEQSRLALESEVVDTEVVEVKSFADVFASKLGGALEVKDRGALPASDELSELDDFMS